MDNNSKYGGNYNTQYGNSVLPAAVYQPADSENVAVMPPPPPSTGCRFNETVGGAVPDFGDMPAVKCRVEEGLSKKLLIMGLVQIGIGLLTAVLGSLALYFYIIDIEASIGEEAQWPVISGSGCWGGLLILTAGCLGYYSSKEAEKETLTNVNMKLRTPLTVYQYVNTISIPIIILHAYYSGTSIVHVLWNETVYAIFISLTVLGALGALVAFLGTIHMRSIGFRMGIGLRPFRQNTCKGGS